MRILRNLSFRANSFDKQNYSMRGMRYDKKQNMLFTIQAPQTGNSYLTKWDVNSFSPVNTIKASNNVLSSIDLSEKNGVIILGGCEGNLYYYDSNNLDRIKTISIGEMTIKSVAISNNDSISGTTDNLLIINPIYRKSFVSISILLKILLFILFIYYIRTKFD